MQQQTIDEREVAQFSRLGREWWNERGAMRMLHRLNPVRLAYIREQAITSFARDTKRLDALAGLRVLESDAAAASCASRWRAWAPKSSELIRRQKISR